ncbi:response regulator [Ferrovibrio sp.]|jgi:two-component system KDP operon response regulator KdpE|uniref:response regulator n=1 Tax=Ferrovibrio sp. TaxID=1917215 RepID=UPI0035B09E8B
MSEMRRILIVDDEAQIRRFLRTALTMNQFEVIEAASGAEAMEQLARSDVSLIVLDMQLGDMDGLDVLRRLREWSWAPVIVLTVRNREMDKIQAFELGADDYLTKPFSIAEFLARIQAVLRRAAPAASEPVFTVEGLSVDLARRRVTLNGAEVKLTPKQYGLLQYLARHAGKVVTHEQLLREVWGAEHAEDVHYLRIFMRKLRQRVERDPARPRYIQTELGVGYRLLAPDQLAAAGE